jgi:hypothetical protein
MQSRTKFKLASRLPGNRKFGLIVFVTAGSIEVVICYGAYVATAYGLHDTLIELLAIPGAFALAGAMQAITGVSFATIASNWQSLAGWQRGIIGLFIVMVAFALAFACMVIIGELNGWI